MNSTDQHSSVRRDVCDVSCSVPDDIIGNIVPHLSDEELRKVLLTSWGPTLLRLLAQPDFWYRRTEVLMQVYLRPRLTDWKLVYCELFPVETIEDCASLDSLVALEVCLEAHGWHSVLLDTHTAWVAFREPQVMDALIARGMVGAPSSETLYEALLVTAEQNKSKMVGPLLSLIRDDQKRVLEEADIPPGLIGKACCLSAEKGSLPVLRTLVESCSVYLNQLGMCVVTAVRANRPAIIEYLLSLDLPISECDLLSGRSCAISFDHPSCYNVLAARIGHSPKEVLEECATSITRELIKSRLIETEQVKWNSLLLDAVHREQSGFVQLCLEYTEVTVEVLLASMTLDSKKILKMLLLACKKDKTVLDLVCSIDLSSYKSRERTAMEHSLCVLAKDVRVQPEVLTPELTRMFLSSMNIVQHVRGFMLAEVASGILSRENALRAAEKTDACSLTLRYVLMKSPTVLQLATWLLSMCKKRQAIALAAREIVRELDGEKVEYSEVSDVSVLRGLLLGLVHETRDVPTLIKQFREMGMNKSDVTRAAKLIGAFRGAN